MKDVIGPYALLCLWYRTFFGRAPVPSKEALEETQAAYVALFMLDAISTCLPFQVRYKDKPVNDDVLLEAWIIFALRKMRSCKAPRLIQSRSNT